MELLFSNRKSHAIDLPALYDPSSIITSTFLHKDRPVPIALVKSDVKYLIYWLRHELLADKARPDLFMQGETMFVLLCLSDVLNMED